MMIPVLVKVNVHQKLCCFILGPALPLLNHPRGHVERHALLRHGAHPTDLRLGSIAQELLRQEGIRGMTVHDHSHMYLRANDKMRYLQPSNMKVSNLQGLILCGPCESSSISLGDLARQGLQLKPLELLGRVTNRHHPHQLRHLQPGLGLEQALQKQPAAEQCMAFTEITYSFVKEDSSCSSLNNFV